jgi:hypothetical protein
LNIIKFLIDKRDQLEKENSESSKYQIELIDETLLFANLRGINGKISFMIISSYELDGKIKEIETSGGMILDIQITMAAPSVSVSTGDREATKREYYPAEVKALIKYIKGN